MTVSRRWRRAGAILMALAFSAVSNGAGACTSFLLASADGGKVYGRTLEFGLPLQSQLVVVPRKLDLVGTGPDGKAGGGLLYMPNVAVFQDVKPNEATNSIASHELLLYTLTSFATVAEARAGISTIKVNRSAQPTFGMPVPIHMTLHDATGASLVVEYVEGELRITDNPTTVMTNGPTIDWHFTNLNNYLNLSVTDPAPRKIGAVPLAPPSTGTGMLGLPGDMSSPSRFVRAFIYARSAPVAPTSAEAVNTALHLLNNFDIPPGTIRTQAGSAAGGGVAGVETTEWIAVADLKARRYYLRNYNDYQVRVIDLTGVALDGTAIRVIPVDKATGPLDQSR